MGALWTGIRLALRAISRNVLRASLTVLGILIGVAAVVTVTALGSGARESVSAQIQSIGSNFLIVFPQNSAASGAKGAQGSGVRLTDDDGQAIRREAVSITAIAPALRTAAQVVSGDRNWLTSVVGTTIDYFTIRNWKLRRGFLWEERDEQLKTKVCILGSTVANNLFGTDDPVGHTIRIGRYPFRVIGVTETKGEAPSGGDQDDVVLMPITSMRSRVMKTPRNFAGVLMASAASADTTDRAVLQVEGILRQRHRIEEGKTPDFVVRTQAEFAAMQESIYNLLTILLICVAGISLLVGGIGVMNIMLVSVAERTREIGIRMAIGAREHDIRTQFLVEAVVLALLGGLAGAAIGIAGIAGLAKTLEWPMSLSPTALAVAIATSGLTGIAFGFFPARRASQLDPIVALRHE
jgi:putative ABC transport system permease protein